MRIPRSHRRLRAPAVLALAAVAATVVPVASTATASPSRSAKSLSAKKRAATKACFLAKHRGRKADVRACRVARLKVVKATAARRRKKWHPTTTTTTTTVPTTTTTTTTTVPTTSTTTTTSTVPTTTTTSTTSTSTTTTPTTSTRLYADSSPFNTKIPASPQIASNSAAMVSKSLAPYVSGANFANSDWWGISIVNARSTDPWRVVGLFDWGYGSSSFPAFRIPDGAAPTLGSDHHLVVLDGGQELDMWVGEQQSDGSWLAGARVISSTTGSGVAGTLAGNAAGFSLAAGVIRPEEIAAGVINHALVFTSPYVRNSFVSPAVHGDGKQSDPDAMPMGTRIQLDPSVDISGLPRYKRIVAQALKDYGAYLVDSSGSLALRGEASIGRGSSDIWGPQGVTDTSLSSLPWSKMRVIAP